MKKIFLTLTLTLLFFSCDKKNALNNECIGDDYSKWTDCESSYTWKDGTFYNGSELDRDMSEIPHPSVEETLELFLNQPVIERNKIYFIHINHTNPILTNKNGVKDLIESYGFNVAKRGLKFNL